MLKIQRLLVLMDCLFVEHSFQPCTPR